MFFLSMVTNKRNELSNDKKLEVLIKNRSFIEKQIIGNQTNFIIEHVLSFKNVSFQIGKFLLCLFFVFYISIFNSNIRISIRSLKAVAGKVNDEFDRQLKDFKNNEPLYIKGIFNEELKSFVYICDFLVLFVFIYLIIYMSNNMSENTYFDFTVNNKIQINLTWNSNVLMVLVSILIISILNTDMMKDSRVLVCGNVVENVGTIEILNIFADGWVMLSIFCLFIWIWIIFANIDNNVINKRLSNQKLYKYMKLFVKVPILPVDCAILFCFWFLVSSFIQAGINYEESKYKNLFAFLSNLSYYSIMIVVVAIVLIFMIIHRYFVSAHLDSSLMPVVFWLNYFGAWMIWCLLFKFYIEGYKTVYEFDLSNLVFFGFVLLCLFTLIWLFHKNNIINFDLFD